MLITIRQLAPGETVQVEADEVRSEWASVTSGVSHSSWLAFYDEPLPRERAYKALLSPHGTLVTWEPSA